MTALDRARDEWLALRCQAKVSGAFEDLIGIMEQPLLYYAIKLTGSRDSAFDVLQEVWVRALRGIAKLKDPATVRAWLYTTVHSVAVDRYRKERTRQRAEDTHTETFDESSAETFTSDDAEAVHRALDSMEPKHREVLVLHFLEDFSLAEISGVLGCPEGTVKSRLFYAKRALRQAITGEKR